MKKLFLFSSLLLSAMMMSAKVELVKEFSDGILYKPYSFSHSPEELSMKLDENNWGCFFSSNIIYEMPNKSSHYAVTYFYDGGERLLVWDKVTGDVIKTTNLGSYSGAFLGILGAPDQLFFYDVFYHGGGGEQRTCDSLIVYTEDNKRFFAFKDLSVNGNGTYEYSCNLKDYYIYRVDNVIYILENHSRYAGFLPTVLGSKYLYRIDTESTTLHETSFPSEEDRGETMKVLKDGQVLIHKSGKIYDINGAEM